MVAQAEKNKAEDDAQKEKVEARNQLENFCYQVKNMVNEQPSGKMSAEDKAAIMMASKDVLEWLDAHKDSSKSEIEGKMKEVRVSSSRLLRRRTSRLVLRAVCPVACREGCLAVSSVLLRSSALRRIGHMTTMTTGCNSKQILNSPHLRFFPSEACPFHASTYPSVLVCAVPASVAEILHYLPQHLTACFVTKIRKAKVWCLLQ